MKIFVIHRFEDRSFANIKLRQIEREWSLKFQSIFLDSSGTEQWKQRALNAINQAEVVIVFNKESCNESDNAKWEINRAQDTGKEIIYINQDSDNLAAIKRLKSLYDLEDEFENVS